MKKILFKRLYTISIIILVVSCTYFHNPFAEDSYSFLISSEYSSYSSLSTGSNFVTPSQSVIGTIYLQQGEDTTVDITFTNNKSIDLTWSSSISTDTTGDWLLLSSSSGSGSGNFYVTFTIRALTLSDNLYSSTAIFNFSDGTDTQTISIPVELTVMDMATTGKTYVLLYGEGGDTAGTVSWDLTGDLTYVDILYFVEESSNNEVEMPNYNDSLPQTDTTGTVLEIYRDTDPVESYYIKKGQGADRNIYIYAIRWDSGMLYATDGTLSGTDIDTVTY